MRRYSPPQPVIGAVSALTYVARGRELIGREAYEPPPRRTRCGFAAAGALSRRVVSAGIRPSRETRAEVDAAGGNGAQRPYGAVDRSCVPFVRTAVAEAKRVTVAWSEACLARGREGLDA